MMLALIHSLDSHLASGVSVFVLTPYKQHQLDCIAALGDKLEKYPNLAALTVDATQVKISQLKTKWKIENQCYLRCTHFIM